MPARLRRIVPDTVYIRTAPIPKASSSRAACTDCFHPGVCRLIQAAASIPPPVTAQTENSRPPAPSNKSPCMHTIPRTYAITAWQGYLLINKLPPSFFYFRILCSLTFLLELPHPVQRRTCLSQSLHNYNPEGTSVPVQNHPGISRSYPRSPKSAPGRYAPALPVN